MPVERPDLDDRAWTAADYRPVPVTHIVLLRYREDCSPEDRAEVERRFRDLQTVRRDGRPLIRSIRAGVQISPEPGAGDYDTGFVLEFASEGDRNYYLGRPFVTDPDCIEPAHDAFKEFVGPFLAPGGALIFDFADEEPPGSAETVP
jgi:hypothetical protein